MGLYILANICLLIVCLAVGSFLYSHIHQGYSIEEAYSVSELEEKIETTEYPTSYFKKIDENFVFDVTINAYGALSGDMFQIATVQKAKMKEESLTEYFLDNAIQPNAYGTMDIEGNRTSINVYESETEYLSVSENYFTYLKNPDIKYIWHAFNDAPKTDQYNSFLYSIESDLAFMPRTDAWEEVVNILSVIGLDMSSASPMKVYSLDVETMERQERYVDRDGNVAFAEKNPHWDKEEEGYYYYITQYYQGIPFYGEPKVAQREAETVAPLIIFQNSYGLIETKMVRWFTSVTKEERYAKLLPIESIMNVIEDKYVGTIYTNPLTVSKAGLFIFPMKSEEGTYILTPVWVCQITERHVDLGEDAYDSYLYMAINALTGEEMLSLVN